MAENDATLAAIKVGLDKLTQSVSELKSDVKDIDTRLRSVEITIASRVRAPTFFAGISAIAAFLGFTFFFLDRMYGGG